jgi:hypothetical protein
MATTATNYTVRTPIPDLLERGKDNVLQAPVWLDGALVAVASSTVSVLDPNGDALVDEEAGANVDSIPTYTVPAAVLSGEPYGEGWQVRWTLTVGSTELFHENDAALVRKVLRPVVSDGDLFRRCSALDPQNEACISQATNYQTYLDEAWVTIQLRLIERGDRPNLILSPSALRESHALLTLALTFEDLDSFQNAYAEKARTYREQFEAAWARLRFVYDTNDDGKADDAGAAKRGGASVLWLAGRGR